MNKKIIVAFTGIVSVATSLLTGGTVFAYKSEKTYKDDGKVYSDEKSTEDSKSYRDSKTTKKIRRFK